MESASTSDLEFYVHDKKYTVKSQDVPPTTSLCDYLRTNLGLTGTKAMCREGGCGVCVVAATYHHPVTGNEVTVAINSCLVSIFSCTGWKISTVEGLVKNNKYHEIQQTLQEENGTQCGYCSPGMVMNMYALQKESKNKLTASQIENSFGGSICRCTGYRPIIKAFRKFASVADGDDFEMVNDIEDIPCSPDKCLTKCMEKCRLFDSALYYESDSDLKWYKAFTIDQILKVFKKYPNSKVRLVAGNTAQGVYRDMAAGEVSIDINSVAELKKIEPKNNELILGGSVTLTEAMQAFKNTAASNNNFKYLQKFYDHVDLVAHVPVRNIGTLAGNLMIKRVHRDFPSDMFLLLESVGATLTIIDSNNLPSTLTMQKFLDFDMTKRVIKSVRIPSIESTFIYESYKIMPRAQNAHAILNAAFLMKIDNGIVKKATIVYGGISPTFIHATKTEQYLLNKNVFTNTTLEGMFTALTQEINPDHVLPDPGPAFRKNLAISLAYKFILSIAANKLPQYVSGGLKLVRDTSVAQQLYTEHPDLYPIGQGINKLEGLAQTSGEAEYIMDIPDMPRQCYGAFVLVKYPAGSKIISVDTSKAKEIKGVVDYVDALDIKGNNSYVPSPHVYPVDDPIFCTSTVQYFNQPIGLIVAESRALAEKAAQLVVVVARASAVDPVINVKDGMNDPNRIMGHTPSPATKPEQYHYHMETQCCSVVPRENGEFDMYPSTQWMDLSQAAAAACMKIPMNKINVRVRRLGGAYGGKISRNGLTSCAAIIAAAKIKRPIKIWMTFEDNMDVIGKRNPIYGSYEAKVDANGVIQDLKGEVYTGVGLSPSEYPGTMTLHLIKNASYNSESYNMDLYAVRTDIPSNTWTRSPGSVEGQAYIETIMEHIAYTLKMDPLEVRKNNLSAAHPLLRKFIEDTETWADLRNRKDEIEAFNKANRWRKRGLAVTPLAYYCIFEGIFSVIVSIYAIDGTVSVSHGGIEMGQGINTKAAQVVAHQFGIDVSKISVKPSNNLVSPNAYVTGGSITSEAVCRALQGCCNNLLSAINASGGTGSWEDRVGKSSAAGVKLTDTFLWRNTTVPDTTSYTIYGVCATEVEFDVLTGNHIVRRVDLLEDTGHSMSPFIDIGQVEGAYIMGQGYWTSEEIIYDKKGQLKNNRTWNYKPPGMKDIPTSFNVKFPDEPNVASPFKTKATAEPPLCLSFSVALALRQAIKSARADAGIAANQLWYPIEGPCTVEQNFMNCGTKTSQFKLS